MILLAVLALLSLSVVKRLMNSTSTRVIYGFSGAHPHFFLKNSLLTSTARIEQFAYVAKHCRLCSSSNVKIRNRVPFSIWSSTKSQLHISLQFSALARTAVEMPNRLIRRCFLVTFHPSSRRSLRVDFMSSSLE